MKIKPLLLFLLLSLASTAYALQPGIKRYHEPIKAPEFVLSDIDNNTHTTADYRNRVLIINFWATWCIPCRKEIPQLINARLKLESENIDLLGIATMDSPENVKQFKKENNIEFPLLLDEDGSIADNWSVIAIPIAFVIDQDGYIVMRIVGGDEWDSPKLIESIIALQAKPAKEE